MSIRVKIMRTLDEYLISRQDLAYLNMDDDRLVDGGISITMRPEDVVTAIRSIINEDEMVDIAAAIYGQEPADVQDAYDILCDAFEEREDFGDYQFLQSKIHNYILGLDYYRKEIENRVNAILNEEADVDNYNL